MTVRRPTTPHTVTITHINDIVGTIPLRGMVPRGTPPLRDETTTPLTGKVVPEILTVKQLRAIDIRIAIPTERAGDLYINEDHA